MAEELTRSLVRLAERGEPRGATRVLAAARTGAGTPAARPWRTRPMTVFTAAAVIVFVVIGAVVIAVRPFGPDSTPVVTTLPEPTTIPSTAPPPETVPGATGAADRIADLAIAPDGSLWAATGAGVVRWDLSEAIPTVFTEGLPDRSIERVAVSTDGTVWAAGSTWLARYDGTWTTPGEPLVPQHGWIGDLAPGPDGSMWVATGMDTLIRIDDEGSTAFTIPSEWVDSVDPWTRSVVVDATGTVWASAIHGGGVFAYDGAWHHYGVEEGLPGRFTGTVAIAPDGSVWVGGEGLYGDPDGDVPAEGVGRFDGTSWTTYTVADGLVSNDAEVVVGSDGTVWAVSAAIPETIAEQLGLVHTAGISRLEGARWTTYPDLGGGGGGAVVGPDGTLWMPSQEGIIGFDGTRATRLVAGPAAVPPVPGVTLEPSGFDPLVVSTSIGEIRFTTWRMPDPWYTITSLTATDHGVLGRTSELLVWSEDGVRWEDVPVSVRPWSIADVGGDVLVGGGDGSALLSWDGTAWVEVRRFGFAADQIAAGSSGVVVADGTRILHSDDGRVFEDAARPPGQDALPDPGVVSRCDPSAASSGISPMIGPIVATDPGFVALTARSPADWTDRPTCEPVVWWSTDGSEWELSSTESPFGEFAFVYDVSERDGRLVAVGGVGAVAGAVWVSDDGLSWQRADIDLAMTLDVAAGERGWIVLGYADGLTWDGPGQMWFSIDGLVWDGPFDRPSGWQDSWGFLDGIVLGDRIVGTGWGYDPETDTRPGFLVLGELLDR